MNSRCEVHRLGLMEYRQAWELQEALAAEIARGVRPPTLLLLQHPHTFTFGRRGKPEHLLWDAAQLAQEGVQVVWSDRGGDITYHGPGQLVGYPLLPLGALYAGAASGPNLAPHRIQNDDLNQAPFDPGLVSKVDYVGYLRRLEETIILALMRLGVASGQIPGLSGVWLQPDAASRCTHCRPELRRAPAKIAAVGVKVDVHGVTRHGFAVNVAPDMRFWDGIIACGLQGHAAASLADVLDPPPEVETVAALVSAAFGEVFGYQMLDVDELSR